LRLSGARRAHRRIHPVPRGFFNRKINDMQYPEMAAFINTLIDKVEQLIPEYMARKEDREKERGGSAVCILDPEGRVYGKMFGTDAIMARERYRVAWIKASQAWITGLPTG